MTPQSPAAVIFKLGNPTKGHAMNARRLCVAALLGMLVLVLRTSIAEDSGGTKFDALRATRQLPVGGSGCCECGYCAANPTPWTPLWVRV